MVKGWRGAHAPGTSEHPASEAGETWDGAHSRPKRKTMEPDRRPGESDQAGACVCACTC